MPNMTLGLDGATIVIQIRNRSYTLTAPNQEITFGTTPGIPKHLRFRYQDSYENAIDVGTINQVMDELQSLIATVPLAAGQSFLEQWNKVQVTLSSAPILGSAITTVINTDVRIVEMELELTRTTSTTPASDTYKGKLGIGVMFTPDPAHRPKIFNIQVLAFGAALHVELEGNASDLDIW
jgi:hypothetical protein